MAANPANVAEIKSYWNSHPGGTQEQLNDYFATHTQFTPDDYIGAFPEISKNPVDWINAINSGVNDYNVRNNVTVAGPGNGNITQADYDAQQRRIGFQNFLAQNLNDPQAVMQYMTQNGISSAEAQNMTDGALGLMAQSKYGDMNTYLRMNGAQDGFQGLKVYTPEQIKNFIDWQKAQNATPAGFNTGGDYQQKQVPVYDTPQAIRNATDAMERAYRVAQVRHDNFGEPIEQEWDNPNWAAITQKKKDDYAALIASRSGGNWAGVGTPQTVAGPVTPGGVQPNPNTGTGGNNASAVPANANAANVAKIRADWANPTGKQEDLDAYFADHMGEFTAADYAAAFPQYGGVDQYMTAIAEGIARWKQTPAGGGYDLNPDALMNAALHGDSTIGMNYKQVNDLLNPKTGFVDPANIRQATLKK